MGLFDKPKTPEPSGAEKAANRRLRKEANDLTEEENRRLKAAKRGRSGRRALLSGTFIPGRNPVAGAGTGVGSTGGSRGGGGTVATAATPRARGGILSGVNRR